MGTVVLKEKNIVPGNSCAVNATTWIWCTTGGGIKYIRFGIWWHVSMCCNWSALHGSARGANPGSHEGPGHQRHVPTMQCNGICSTTLRRSACSSAFILVHLASAPELSEPRSSTNTPMATSVFELFNMRINIHTSTYRITLLVPKYAIVRVMPSWPPLLTSVQVLCWS